MKIGELVKKINTSVRQRLNRLNSAYIIAFGYLAVIFIGTALLMLPVSSKGETPCFLDALFTATSATCVTGLAVFDTYTQWSVFGQTVIIFLIQIGGLGFMTILALAALAMRGKLGMKQRSILTDSINGMSLRHTDKTVKNIVIRTLSFEAVGAALLAVRFIPRMGASEGVGNALFMSISAFCNAGFDLNGKYGEYSSLCEFYNDPLVCITVCMLVLIGGIGFSVWDDISRNKLRFSAYSLHSRLALIITALLTVVGTVLFFIFERDHTNAGAGVGQSLLNSFFDSVTPRTAGFNTVDTAALSPASTMLTVFYMFIGGSPGSTAGGVKTITVTVLIAAAIANMTNREDVNISGRRLKNDIVPKALTVVAINLMIVLTGIICITAAQPELPAIDVIFEGFSAINTVGMTTGITRELIPFSRAVIAVLMFCGRVGSVSFAFIFAGEKISSGTRNPEEDVFVG